MKLNPKLKNTVLAGLAGLTLTACGGGGGGGAGVVIDNTRETVNILSSAVFNQHGGSTNVDNDSITGSIAKLASISNEYSVQNTDRQDAQLVVQFLNEWESFNAELETMKNSTTGRADFDAYMNHSFGNSAELEAAGLAGKTWRDAHKEIHGAYLLLVKHKSLITRYANGETIYADESAYKNFVNDSELKQYENLNDTEIDSRLKTKAETDANLIKYNDDALADKNISELDTIQTIVDNAVNTISSLESTISGVISDNSIINGALSNVVNYHDVEKSKNIIVSVESAITEFEKIKNDYLVNSGLTVKQKLDYYKSEEYKTAYKSYLYLKNDVKPILDRIKNAGTDTVELDTDELNTLATDGKNNYATAVDNEINPKIVTLEDEYKKLKTVIVPKQRTFDEDPVAFTGESVITYTNWATVYQGGGDEQRTKTTTTPNYTKVVTKKCTWEESTFDGVTTVGPETCTTVGDPAVTTGEPTVATEIETRTGDNPVVETIVLEPVITTSTEESDLYTVTTYTDASETTTDTEEGSATTTTENREVTTITDNGDNSTTTITTRYVDTIVTTPITTKVYRTRHYTDTVKKDTRPVTTTTTVHRLVYKDETTEDVNIESTNEVGDWTTTQISESTRSENILQSEETTQQVVTTSDSGTEIARVTTTNSYTDNDSNLGTKTVNYNSDKTTYETDEYNEDNNGFGGGSYNYVNASSAYSKGWTGEGSIVAVADTGYDTDHSEFEGKIVATKDYYGNGIQDNQGHGSHVLGTIVAKKDGSGIHGVAFDAKAVVIKIGDSRSVSLDSAADGFSWAADQGAIVGNLSANSNYDSSFRRSIVAVGDNTYKSTSQYYDYENGTYYNGLTTDIWKQSTDKGLILVNSAGNQGLDISAMPGWFATETDANGNLVLGGKVLIVGSYNVNTGSVDSFSNKAGHLCRVIVDDACRDQYKTSDFYVLAPGSTYSTNKDGGYSNLTGTSMAAPIVTGQIAILHQMWPHMKGENLVKLVTTTANKSITGYDVNIHGQGLVDFDEATKPQGAVGIPTTGRVDGSTSSISTTSISGSGSMQAVLSNFKIMVLDDFDRDYYLNLGNSFTVKDNRKYSDVEMLVDNKNTFLPHQQMYGSFAQGGQYDLAKNYNFGLYTGENGNGDYSLNVGKDFYLNNKFKVKTSVGYMSEQDTWLGNTSEGVLAVGDNNDTTSANIGVAYQLGNNVLTLDYSKGSTDINTADGSLIKSFSDIETESYRLAYEIHKDTHTTFGWSFSLPSHITSGTMDLEVAESVNLDGTINYTNINSDLAQGTKEKNIGFFYSKSGEDELDASFNFTAEYRTDKSGVANNDGVEMAVKMVKKFAGNCKFLWMKNPKCFDKDGNMKSNLFGTSIDNATKHGLVYDLKTDKFIPIKK
jgi:subtilisin family serine protease